MSARSGKPEKKATDKTSTFEGAINRLEGIVTEMEKGSLSLDDMIKRFEEGQALIAFCTKKLNEVERKVEKLVTKGSKVVAEPFDDADDADDGDEEEEEDEDLF